MKIMNGKLHQKSLLKVFQTSISTRLEMFILLFLGMIAIFAHARFRSGINIPGHHGLEFMALLMVGRAASKIKWASLFFSIGVISLLFIPFLGFKNPIMSFVFLIPGISVDIFYNSIKKYNNKIWFLSLVGGISYGLVPIIRLLLTEFTGIIHKSLLLTPVYTITTHIIFGTIGSIIGVALIRVTRKKQ